MARARINVNLTDHERAILAGSAMYLWTWGQLWLKKHRSRDRRIPAAVALRCPWESAAENAKAAARLVEARLWLPDGGDAIVVWNGRRREHGLGSATSPAPRTFHGGRRLQ